ncbi:MAG: hypothetical protein ACREX9_24165, partial [Gammaproteobacteria bacterium]
MPRLDSAIKELASYLKLGLDTRGVDPYFSSWTTSQAVTALLGIYELDMKNISRFIQEQMDVSNGCWRQYLKD